MEIKDIAVSIEQMEDVRGGNAVVNTFVGGNASSSVSFGGVRALHSPISLGVSTVAANEVLQGGTIEDRDISIREWSISDSIGVGIGARLGRWGRYAK